MTIDDAILTRFRGWHQEAWADAAWATETRERMKLRKSSCEQILALLADFLLGKCTLQEFRTVFDKRTRTDWDQFGLKAMSGAMFLNMMTLHLPDQAELAQQLKHALVAPKTEADGRALMAEFFNYLNSTLAKHHMPVRKVQPRRASFFLSAWWHMQNTADWPIFYGSARSVLLDQGLITESQDLVSDYMAFRTTWLALLAALKLEPWDLELVCARVAQADTTVVEPEPPMPESAGAADEGETPADATHAEVQWLLAELGQRLGCKVWIAANDHSKQWNGTQLKTLSIPSLPNLGMGEDAQKIINLIDVIWLKGGKQVVAAFEVESTTSIYSGLLRMADLITTCPNLNILCFIAVPGSRASLVVKQLSRPTFQSIDLNARCGFFTFENLKKEAPAMVKWAKDPAIIRKLATFVGDTDE